MSRCLPVGICPLVSPLIGAALLVGTLVDLLVIGHVAMWPRMTFGQATCESFLPVVFHQPVTALASHGVSPVVCLAIHASVIARSSPVTVSRSRVPVSATGAGSGSRRIVSHGSGSARGMVTA